MGKIIKSILFQMKVGYFWKKVWLLFLIFVGIMLSFDIYLDKTLGTVTKALAAEGDVSGALLLAIPILAILVSAEICGNDFSDKTINYELLSGHSRLEVYFARVIVSISLCIITVLLLLLLPLLFFAMLGYWGDTLELSGLLLRLGLLVFLLFRLSCEIIFLTCITKNTFLSTAIGSVFFMLENTLSGMFRHCNPYLMSSTNMTQLFAFSEWSTYSVTDLKNVAVYQSLPDASLTAGTIAASLIIGFLSLFLGCCFFQTDDLQ